MIAGKLIAEAESFLDVIFENQADDTPRLVYADWLQEHNEEAHARLIRVQCELAQTEPGTDRAMELWIESGKIWRDLQQAWAFELWDFPGLDVTDFSRGFLDVTVVMEDDVFFGRSMRYTWPRIPFLDVSLHLYGDDLTLGDVLTQPCLRGTRELFINAEIASTVSAQQWNEAHRLFTGLEVLSLAGSPAYDETFLEQCIQSPLRRLILESESDSLSKEMRVLLNQRFGPSCV